MFENLKYRVWGTNEEREMTEDEKKSLLECLKGSWKI